MLPGAQGGESSFLCSHDAGAKSDVPDKDGDLPIKRAAFGGHVEVRRRCNTLELEQILQMPLFCFWMPLFCKVPT